MYIGRNEDGSLYGYWTCKQPDDEFHPRLEEVADDHPDLLAFQAAQAARFNVTQEGT